MVKESSWKACNWDDKSDRQPSKKWKKEIKLRGLNYESELGGKKKVERDG